MTDLEALSAYAQTRDADAFRHLVTTYQAMVHGICTRVLESAFLLAPRVPARITPGLWKEALALSERFEPGPAPALPARPPSRPAGSGRGMSEEEARRRVAELRAEAVRLASEAGDFLPARGARIYGCHPATFKKKMIEAGLAPGSRTGPGPS